MNQLWLILSAVLFVLTAALAYLPEQEISQAPESEIGRSLNMVAGEVTAEQVARLEITAWSSVKSEKTVFQVRQNSAGAWIIPSHYDYPADGGTRLGDTAGAFLNLKTGRLVTDSVNDHAELEVLDPSTEGLTSGAGVGKRLTLSDAGAKALVDVIIGKADNEGGHYLRLPNENKVYSVQVRPDLRTAFADWVERSLFKESRSAIADIAIEDYSVNETTGTVTQRSQTLLRKKDSLWTSPQLPANKQIASDAIDALVNEFIGLRLEGVRPYQPEWLQQRGFYVAADGSGGQRLVGNEGRIVVTTETGIVYVLFFGEVALGDGDDQTAEVEISSAQGENRYMAVFVSYDDNLDRRYQEAEKMRADALAAGMTEADIAKDGLTLKNGDVIKDIPALVKNGQQRAEELQQRFGAFFYVIRDDSFQKLRPAVTSLFIDPPKDDE